MPFDTEEELFYDALFRQRRKHGVYRLVEAPQMEGPVADTHCHTHLLPDPALAFARCAANGVDFVCNMIDVVEDAPTTRENVRAWLADAETVLPQIMTYGLQNAQGATNDAVAGAVGAAAAAGAAGTGDADAMDAVDANAAPGKLPRVCFAMGCHPHNAKDYTEEVEQRLREALRDPQVRAVGEIGLDFHYDLSPRDVQERVFRQQLHLAHELGLPVVLHIREAHDVALRVLEQEGFPAAGVLLHCFNLGPEDIDPWLAHDCYIGLGGPLTFKKSDYTREAAKKVPLNRLVTETDAPYMTPEPMRGITCWTDHVIFTADALARVRGCVTAQDRRRFFAALHANALRFYGFAEEG